MFNIDYDNLILSNFIDSICHQVKNLSQVTNYLTCTVDIAPEFCVQLFDQVEFHTTYTKIKKNHPCVHFFFCLFKLNYYQTTKKRRLIL